MALNSSGVASTLKRSCGRQPTGDSEIEQRCPFADVAEIEEPNKSYRLAVINHPEARDVRA